jgi:hypothetical protein
MSRLQSDIEENDQEIQEITGQEKQVIIDIETITKEIKTSRKQNKGDEKPYWIDR